MNISKPLLFIFLIYFFQNPLFAQQNLTNFEELKSNGLPSENLRNYIDFRLVPNSISQENTKKISKDLLIKQVVNSGYLIFGNEINTYLNAICDEISSANNLKKIEILVLKSNLINTFNDSKSLIFIPTALIAQTVNKDQIAYFIAREMEHLIKNDSLARFTKTNGINEIQLALSNYKFEREKNADLEALRLLEKTNFRLSKLSKCIELIYLANLPYEDIAFDNTYFNNEFYFIPNQVIDLERDFFKEENKGLKYNQIDVFTARNENFTTFLSKINIVSNNTNEPSSEFLYFRNLARLDLLKTDLIQANYTKNLYHIYVLEKEFPNSKYIQILKAHTWFGFLNNKIGNINKTFDRGIYSIKNESVFFQFFINRMDLYAIASLNLRIITDIEKKLPTDLDIVGLSKKSKIILSNLAYFDINKFQKYTLKDAISRIKSQEGKDKYEKNTIFENKQLLIDTSSYFLYGISDLMNRENFVAEFLKLKELNEKVDFSSKSFHIPMYHFNLYSKSFLNLKKSTEIEKTLTTEDKFLNAEFKNNNYEIFDVNNFNRCSYYKQLIDQLDFYKSNQNKVIPILHESISDKKVNSVSYIPIYESYRKYHLKGFQALGFLMVPIIAVVNDFSLNNYKSNYKNILIDNTTSEILFYSDVRNRLRMNKFSALNYFFTVRNFKIK